MNHQRTNLISKEMLRASRRRKTRRIGKAAAWCCSAAIVAMGAAAGVRAVPAARKALASRAVAQAPVLPSARTAAPSLQLPPLVSPQRSDLSELPGLKDLETAIRDKFGASKTLVGLETRQADGALDITFSTDRIFPGGTADFLAGNAADISALVGVIQAQAKDYEIQVEGHTDSVPIVRNRKQFRTNWELSGARAAAVVRLFEQAGVAKDRLEAISFGESRPRFSTGPRNRRLVIRVVKKERKAS